MDEQDDPSELERFRDEKERSLVAEFLLFMKENKAWWITPLLVSLLLLGVLVFFSSHGAAPFIYRLF